MEWPLRIGPGADAPAIWRESTGPALRVHRVGLPGPEPGRHDSASAPPPASPCALRPIFRHCYVPNCPHCMRGPARAPALSARVRDFRRCKWWWRLGPTQRMVGEPGQVLTEAAVVISCVCCRGAWPPSPFAPPLVPAPPARRQRGGLHGRQPIPGACPEVALQAFDSVVGQEHITRTLKNAISPGASTTPSSSSARAASARPPRRASSPGPQLPGERQAHARSLRPVQQLHVDRRGQQPRCHRDRRRLQQRRGRYPRIARQHPHGAHERAL